MEGRKEGSQGRKEIEEERIEGRKDRRKKERREGNQGRKDRRKKGSQGR